MFTATMINYDNTATALHEGFTLSVSTEHDHDSGTPWDNDDSHGPVSDWRPRDSKAPGELILSQDRSMARFYDYAAAVRMARADGWGFAPSPMTTARNSGGRWHAWFGTGHEPGQNVGGFTDINQAVRALYAAHKATYPSARAYAAAAAMSNYNRLRAYAAAAAMSNYNRLRAWCSDEWYYMGVIVTAKRTGIELGSASLWGIESDCGAEYIAEVANDLVGDAIDQARATIAALVEQGA